MSLFMDSPNSLRTSKSFTWHLREVSGLSLETTDSAPNFTEAKCTAYVSWQLAQGQEQVSLPLKSYMWLKHFLFISKALTLMLWPFSSFSELPLCFVKASAKTNWRASAVTTKTFIWIQPIQGGHCEELSFINVFSWLRGIVLCLERERAGRHVKAILLLCLEWQSQADQVSYKRG